MVVRGPIVTDELGDAITTFPFQRVQSRYNEWAAQDPSRLRRNERRWRYWRWIPRTCEPAPGGYVCVEPHLCREALVAPGLERWPVMPGTSWLGLESLTKALGVPLSSYDKELFVMAHSMPSPVPDVHDRSVLMLAGSWIGTRSPRIAPKGILAACEMGNSQIFTSESVSEGHPDKVADQISDALLDHFLIEDEKLKVGPGEHCRVAIETMLAHGVAIVSGEVTSHGYVNIQTVVRDTIKSIGYTDTQVGFDGENCGVLVAIQPQSPDIARGVDTGGAGDQGMMFGMATRETADLMPLPISIAHALMRQSACVRWQDTGIGFRPDAKSQVSIVYENGKPKRIDTDRGLAAARGADRERRPRSHKGPHR